MILAGSGIATAAAVPSQLPKIEGRIAGLRRPQLEEDSPTGELTPREMATVMALAEVLVPIDGGFRGIEEVIERHVRQRTLQTKGYLQEYRKAVALLDETAEAVTGHGPFMELSKAEREEVVAALLWKYNADDHMVRRLERLFLSKEGLTFRRFIVRDILAAFFRKSRQAAWAIVGYDLFPGRPQDPQAYARMP